MAKNVVLRFLSETVGLEKGFKKAETSAQSLAGKVTAVGRKFSDLPGPLGAVASRLQDVGTASGVAGPAVAGVAAAVGAGVFVVKQSVDAFMSLAAQIRDVQRVTGGTAEEASLLVAVADDFEVSSEGLSKSMGKLARTVETTPGVFDQYGVAIARNKDGTTDLIGTLANAADAYAATSDSAAKAALGAALFGRGYQELIPLLEGGSRRLREAFADAEKTGQILDQDQLNKAEDFRLSLDQLGDTLRGIGLAVGDDVLPTLTGLVDMFTALTDKAAHSGASMGDALNNVLPGLGFLSDQLGKLMGKYVAQAKAEHEHRKAVSDAAKAARDAADAAREQEQEVEKATEALKRHRSASESLVRSQEGAADAQKALSDLLKKGRVDAKEVAQAEENLATARERVTEATDKVTEAQKALDDARKPATAEEISDAELGIEDAHNRVEKATSNLEDAFKKLHDAQNPVAATFAEMAGAEANVEDKTVKLAKAQADLVDATERLAGLRAHGGLVSAKDLRDAELDLEQAQADVDSSQADVLQSQDDLTATREKGVVKAEDVKAAEQGIKDAQIELKQATDNAETSEAELQATLLKGAEDSEAVKAAKNGVKDANKELAGATKDVADRETELRTARAGDPEFDDRVAQARRSVRDANYGVRDATESLKDSVDKLSEAYKGLGGAVGGINWGALQRDTGNITAGLSQAGSFMSMLAPAQAAVGGGATYNITVNGFIGNDQDLARKMSIAIDEYKRKNGS